MFDFGRFRFGFCDDASLRAALLLWRQRRRSADRCFLACFVSGPASFPPIGERYNRRYVIGPTAELHFPLHFSFEVDALYRRNGFEYTTYQYFFYPVGPTYTAVVNYFSRATINDWQVPLLAKYELRAGWCGRLWTQGLFTGMCPA